MKNFYRRNLLFMGIANYFFLGLGRAILCAIQVFNFLLLVFKYF